MENNKAKALLEKYNSGNCKPNEKVIVESWFLEATRNITDQLAEPDFDALKLQLWLNINNAKKESRVKTLLPKLAAAASIILFLLVGGYFLLYKQNQSLITKNQASKIPPGGNKAILILSDDREIVLTDAKNGKLAVQGNTSINKTSDGKVVYRTSLSQNNNQTAKTQYNILKTPRGGKFDLILSDGTKVWLNAESSIRYPTAFASSERRVEITGEAYFEVVHNAAKPFKVTAAGQTIEDLGTQFNINTYADEQFVKTTLLEGSIKIGGQGRFKVLKPGQQAQSLFGQGRQAAIVVVQADTEEAIAWHLGKFKFNRSDIKTVMRQMMRWYDMDVGYEGSLPSKKLSGEIYRSVNGVEALEILKDAKVNFRVENKKVIIMP